MSDTTYQCPVCKLHYRDQATADQCAEFCRTYHGCSLEITRKSIEHEEAMKAQQESAS